MEKNIFNEYLKELNIELTDEKYNKLIKYYEMLIEWNEKINLTNIIEKEQVFLKHFYDSLTINKVVNLNKLETLCDIGTGAGFPGIVLKIVFPNIKITLIDSLTKRITFLNLVKETLKLENLEIINARSEEYAKNNKEKFDIVTSRAVAKLNILLEITAPLIKVNGHFIAMKALHGQEELDLSKNAIKKLGLKVEKIEIISIPIICDARTLIKLTKNEKTPKIYPREFKQIIKNPL